MVAVLAIVVAVILVLVATAVYLSKSGADSTAPIYDLCANVKCTKRGDVCHPENGKCGPRPCTNDLDCNGDGVCEENECVCPPGYLHEE